MLSESVVISDIIPDSRPIYDMLVNLDPTEPGELVVDKVDNIEIKETSFPGFCKTQKERDCWTLFQKMAKKGNFKI